jgi:energy-coupling factor transporter ATP-binding protein EcfA2
MGMTDNIREFSPELLTQSKKERLDFFKDSNRTIMHRNLKIAYDRTYSNVHEPAGASITLVMGPSGAGKTTLLRLLEKKILEESFTKMVADPGWIPIVCVEAIAPGKDTFRWKNFYQRTLMAVDEPAIDQKINYKLDGISREPDKKLSVHSRATEDALRLALEKALSHRRPHTLAVDEFQDIGKMASQQVLESHLDTVKSMVNCTKIPWTGFGTYQLLKFLELSPQLSRRTKIIHLQRYRIEFDEDIKEFKRTLLYFQSRMPLPQMPPLEQKYWEFCYEQCIGCIGTLKDWLTNALALALEEKATTLTLEHLTQTARLSSECFQMAQDAIEGEERLADSEKKRKELRELLGLDKKNNKGSGGHSQQQKDALQPQKQKKKVVGKRNPQRDSVGGVD